jgi:hypothetical protein
MLRYAFGDYWAADLLTVDTMLVLWCDNNADMTGRAVRSIV